MNWIENITFPTAACIIVGVFATFFYGVLSKNERWILLIIYLNIMADLISIYQGSQGVESGHVYNILSPIEKIITVVVYMHASSGRKFTLLNTIAMVGVVLLSILGYVLKGLENTFHMEVYILSGFFIAILSYVFLRRLTLMKREFSIVIFCFGLANLVYYTLMISSMSAIPAALLISNDFAYKVLLGNDIAFTLWSLIILTGILWKRIKN